MKARDDPDPPAVETRRSPGELNALVVARYDVEHPSAGGAEAYLDEVLGRLTDRGHDVTLLSTGHPRLASSVRRSGYRIERRQYLSSDNRNQTLLGLKASRETFRGDYDVLLVNTTAQPFYLFAAVPTVYVVHIYNGRDVFDFHDFPVNVLAYVREQVKFRMLRGSNVVSVGGSLTENLSKFGFRHVRTIPNGVDTDTYRPVAEKTADPSVVFLGELSRRKNVDRLPRMYSELKTEHGDLTLHIAGKGELADRIAAFSDDHPDVHYHGYVSEERKVELLSKAWVYVLPSKTEAFPLTILESLACGTPVVAFREAVGPDVVDDEVGRVVSESFDRLTAATAEVLRADGFERCRERASRYSWERHVDDLERYLANRVGE